MRILLQFSGDWQIFGTTLYESRQGGRHGDAEVGRTNDPQPSAEIR